MSVEIGDEAPDFELPSHTGETVRLSSFRGERPVALVFYPFTFTGVCQGELCQLRDDHREFESAGVQVLALSCDSKHAQKRWAEDQGWNFPVLSDFWPHGEVSKAYGVFDDKLGAAKRGTFVIGTDGKVVDKFESPDLGTAREKSRYEEAIAKL
jgi:mycoredoxin-dependent peroxiredoxin